MPSCSTRTSMIAEDCPRASGAGAWRDPVPCPARTWHSPCSRGSQSPDTRRGQSTHKLCLKIEEVRVRVRARTRRAASALSIDRVRGPDVVHNLLKQWTAGVSSRRFRQTEQNFRLCCVGSDQQCATGFRMRYGATPRHGVITFVTHFSCTIKLQTAAAKGVWVVGVKKKGKFQVSKCQQERDTIYAAPGWLQDAPQQTDSPRVDEIDAFKSPFLQCFCSDDVIGILFLLCFGENKRVMFIEELSSNLCWYYKPDSSMQAGNQINYHRWEQKLTNYWTIIQAHITKHEIKMYYYPGYTEDIQQFFF